MKNNKWLASLLVLLLSACSTGPQIDNQSLNEAATKVDATPYAVGSQSFFIHDETRPFDSVAGVNTGIRTLLTEVWYPVAHSEIANGQYRRATYGDYVLGDREIHQKLNQH